MKFEVFVWKSKFRMIEILSKVRRIYTLWTACSFHPPQSSEMFFMRMERRAYCLPLQIIALSVIVGSILFITIPPSILTRATMNGIKSPSCNTSIGVTVERPPINNSLYGSSAPHFRARVDREGEIVFIYNATQRMIYNIVMEELKRKFSGVIAHRHSLSELPHTLYQAELISKKTALNKTRIAVIVIPTTSYLKS